MISYKSKNETVDIIRGVILHIFEPPFMLFLGPPHPTPYKLATA